MFDRDLIQIAGVLDEAEARMLVECGVNLIGLPLRLAVHAEDISTANAAEIVRGLPPDVRGVLITYLDRAEEIVSLCRELGVRTVQLHGEVSDDQLHTVRKLAPELAIIKSLVVGLHAEAVMERMVQDFAPLVDAFITDTFDPETGAAGATGRTHDWQISRRLVRLSPRPVILAGGLTPENVTSAIEQVRPAGVDAHTGVEDADGRKSRAKVAQFVAQAKAGFRAARATAGSKEERES